MFTKIKALFALPAKVDLLIATVKMWVQLTSDMSEGMETVLEVLQQLVPEEELPPGNLQPDWTQIPMEELPSEYKGFKVEYVLVTEETALEVPTGGKDFDESPDVYFSECLEFGGDLRRQRTYARAGKVLQVFKEGDRYDLPHGHDNTVNRAWAVDGGGRAYRLTPWQRVQGRNLTEHPDQVLLINLVFCEQWPSS
jgi:hypothetical protein